MNADEVRNVAALARLGLTEEETRKLGAQFADILKYIRKIDEADIAGVEPASHPFDIHNVFREDKPVPPMGADELMKIAPAQKRGMIRVPKVIEGKS